MIYRFFLHACLARVSDLPESTIIHSRGLRSLRLYVQSLCLCPMWGVHKRTWALCRSWGIMPLIVRGGVTNNIKRVDFGVPTSWFLGAQMLTSSKPIYFWWLCDQSLFFSGSASCLKRAVYYLGSAIKAYLFLIQIVHNLLDPNLEIVSKSVKMRKSADFLPSQIHRLGHH